MRILIFYVKRNSKNQNPYIPLLENALLKENVKIFFPEKKLFFFPITRNILSTKCSIVHLQWIHEIVGFNSRNLLKWLLKGLISFFDINIAKYLVKTKIVWTIHNLYSHESKFTHLDKLFRKFISNKIDALICHCTEGKKKFLIEYSVPLDKIHIVQHGNYLKCYKNEISKEEARKYLNLKKEDLIFLYFGSIRPYKGVEKLINIFKSLNGHQNAKLLIVGKPMTNEFKNKLVRISSNSKNLELELKFIPDEKLQVYFNASDVFVASHKEILTSGAIILAMGFGKAIIAPKLGCISDILNDKGAFLYNSKKKNGLLKALNKSIEKKDFLTQMGKYNFNSIENVSWTKIAKKTKNIYYKLLN